MKTSPASYFFLALPLALFAALAEDFGCDMLGVDNHGCDKDAGYLCVEDPVARCVTKDECDKDDRCPSGMACLVLSEEDGGADAGAVKRCFAAARTETTNLLLATEFGVESFKLVNNADMGQPAEFIWKAPEGTKLVSCALYGCAPVVRVNEQKRAVDGLEVKEISNYWQCVLSARQFEEPGDNSFGLVSLERPEAPGDAGCIGTPDLSNDGQKNITALLVGCLAYDDVKLIGASELVEVRPNQIGQNNGVLTAACTPETAKLNCGVVSGQHTFFGVCAEADGGCRTRCMFDSDCMRPGPSFLDAGLCDEDGCTFTCTGDASFGACEVQP